MSDQMINKTNPTPKKGVAGIGDTTETHYKEWDMNVMNNPISGGPDEKSRFYNKGQPK